MAQEILADDPKFPPALREIPHPPRSLYIEGTIRVSPEDKIFAIVGTRKATVTGKETAREFARELARRGVIIVSGLAFGIDAAAHTGALEGEGKTWAVLAGGLDQIYPPAHESLARRILKSGGALISEYPTGVPAYQSQFLERNRIVSGLSCGVLIIEAPVPSGALATARFALEQNRDVYVLPGPAKHPNFRGSHKLIREGAALVASPQDLMEDLGIAAPEIAPAEADISPIEFQILTALKSAGRRLTIDEILETTKLAPHAVNANITLLLLKGLVREEIGGYAI